MSRRPPARALGAAVLAAALALPALAAPKRAPVTMTMRQADAALASAPGAERDRAFAAWMKSAPLADLVYLLRHDPARLGTLEGPLVRAALERCPAERAALRRRLTLRLALADPVRSAKELGPLSALVGQLPVRPRASVFRLAVLLPDTGAYAPYARAVRAGVDAALADANSVSLRPVEIEAGATGGDAPARSAEALERASNTAGLVIGDLLSVPTLVAASAARILGTPLISPTATDESVGRVAANVFQIGPSSERRGAVLARHVVDRGARRVGVLLASDLEDSGFARGFAAAAESLGAEIAWRGTFAPGTGDHRAIVRAIAAKKLDALFVDGEPRDLRQLLAQLGRDAVNVSLVGGDALAPEQHQAEARVLLEGVRFVADDWEVPAGIQARLDSVATALGEPRGGSLFVRGYFAGRFAGAALLAGPLDPEEITAYLRGRRDPLAAAREAGFLDCASEGARLTVRVVERGRTVFAQ